MFYNYWYYVQYFVLVQLCITAHVQYVVVPHAKKTISKEVCVS